MQYQYCVYFIEILMYYPVIFGIWDSLKILAKKNVHSGGMIPPNGIRGSATPTPLRQNRAIPSLPIQACSTLAYYAS